MYVKGLKKKHVEFLLRCIKSKEYNHLEIDNCKEVNKILVNSIKKNDIK